MIADPPILIMDEPTAGLDPIQIRETLALIAELGDSHTILLSTHILSEVEAVCEKVIIINAGRIGMIKSLAEVDAKNVLTLEVRGPTDQVLTALKAVDGVTKAAVDSKGGGAAAFVLETRDNSDIRDKIANLVIEKSWGLLQLGYRRRTLEDAFFDVMREHNPLKEAIVARAPTGDIQNKTASSAVNP